MGGGGVIWSHIRAERPEPKGEDELKRVAAMQMDRGMRGLDPCPICPAALSSLYLLHPSLGGGLLFAAISPSPFLKPEQHGGEPKRTLASWESKLSADRQTDSQIGAKTHRPSDKERNLSFLFVCFFSLSRNSCNISPLPF